MEINNNINEINNITNGLSSLNIADDNSNSNKIDIVETNLENDLENDDNHYFNNMNLDNDYKKENEIIQVYNNINLKICISKKDIRDIQYLKKIICGKYNEIHNQIFYPANLRISDINGNEIKYLYQLKNIYYLFIAILPINCNLHI